MARYRHPHLRYCAILLVISCVQRGVPGCSRNYEGLDAADMDAPPPPHHYAGLGVHAPAAALDSDGYLLVVGEPKYGGHPKVSSTITVIIINSLRELT